MRYAGAWFALLLLATAVALACSDAPIEEGAASSDVASGSPSVAPAAASPTLPFVTPPFTDCVGTPPPGWMTPASASGSGCVLLPTPDPCARVTVGGREVCLPHEVMREVCCTGGGPETTTIHLGGSTIAWRTVREKDVLRDDLLEWSVLPEHEAAFADLRAAFEAAGQAVP